MASNLFNRPDHYAYTIIGPSPSNDVLNLAPQPLIVEQQPDQRVCIEQNHGFSTRCGFVSASHSAPIGAVISPKTLILSRSRPKGAFGFAR